MTPPLGPGLQAQKENYRQEKKRATKQLFNALTDPSVVIMADSLKVGGGQVCGPGLGHLPSHSGAVGVFGPLFWISVLGQP